MLSRRNNEVGFYNPFRELEEFEKRFFAEPFGFFGRNWWGQFQTDIRDEGDAYVLEADLPGFNKEDIKVDINNDVMTIKAERKSQKEEKDNKGRYICCERSYGSYVRQFDLTGINADNITAKYENGVLTMTLPKLTPTASESRRIVIE
ncbi:MAG: Hsp20/alpha crystallin family protein [Eubacteriales bacterium]|jgi:HSP20 family protein